jgi:hypothetical protein
MRGRGVVVGLARRESKRTRPRLALAAHMSSTLRDEDVSQYSEQQS